MNMLGLTYSHYHLWGHHYVPWNWHKLERLYLLNQYLYWFLIVCNRISQYSRVLYSWCPPIFHEACGYSYITSWLQEKIQVVVCTETPSRWLDGVTVQRFAAKQCCCRNWTSRVRTSFGFKLKQNVDFVSACLFIHHFHHCSLWFIHHFLHCSLWFKHDLFPKKID